MSKNETHFWPEGIEEGSARTWVCSSVSMILRMNGPQTVAALIDFLFALKAPAQLRVERPEGWWESAVLAALQSIGARQKWSL